MSLINKMLRDLDKRDMPQPEALSRSQLKVTPAAPTRSVSAYMIIVMLFLVLLVVALFWFFQQKRLSFGQVATAPALARQTDPVRPAFPPIQPPVQIVTKDAVQTQVEILTQPRKRLVAGVIKAEQLQLGTTEKEETQPTVDEQQAVKLAELTPYQSDTRDETQLMDAQRLTKQEQRSSIARDTERAVRMGEKQQQRAEPESPSVAKLVANDTRKNGKSVQIKKSHARQFDTAQMLTQARRYLRRGHLQEAEPLLKQAMTHNPENRQVRELLVTLLMQDDRNEEAITLLEQSMHRSPDYTPYILLRARLFAALAEIAKGVRLLEIHQPERENETEYLTLLGALYQQQRNYRKALNLYRRLVKLQPGSGRVWAGLALSLDALGEGQAALQAYQRTLGLHSLPAEIERYARQRVSALKVEYGR